MPVIGEALRKTVTWTASERPRWGTLTQGIATVAGVNITPETAMRAAAVYASVTLITDTASSLPVGFLLREDQSRTPQFPESVRAFWGRPNPDQTRPAFYSTMLLSMLLWGELFAFPRRNQRGDVIECWPLDPNRITEIERIEEGSKDNPQLGLKFRVEDFGWVENRPGKPVEMLHIPINTLPGRIRGISPIKQQMELIGMTLSAEEHAARFLGDGVHMSGVIEAKNITNVADAKELQESFNLAHAGPKNAGRVGVLTGDAVFKSLTIPPNELQFIEQMKYSDRKIASIYRVPPHMVGDVEKSTSWGTGIEEQTKGFVQYTLTPLLTKIEKAIEAAFLDGTKLRMRFNVNGLLRGAPADRMNIYRTMHAVGAMNADQMRELEDWAPLPDGLGQRYFIPLNLAAVASDSEEPDAEAVSLSEQAEAASALIRAGFSPADAARVAGLPAMEHIGLPPVTVQPPRRPVEDDEGTA